MLKLNIKKYRMLKKLSQLELANRVGVSQNYISLLERDCRTKSPTLHTIELISKALDVCVCDLITCNCNKCKR